MEKNIIYSIIYTAVSLSTLNCKLSLLPSHRFCSLAILNPMQCPTSANLESCKKNALSKDQSFVARSQWSAENGPNQQHETHCTSQKYCVFLSDRIARSTTLKSRLG